jgi:hypothetical protein
MPATYALQMAETRVRTNTEQKGATAANALARPCKVVTTRFCLSRVSHKVSYNHFRDFAKTPKRSQLPQTRKQSHGLRKQSQRGRKQSQQGKS